MSGVENYLRQKAAEARHDNPDLISGDELMRRMAAAKGAERAEAQRSAEHAEKLAELKAIRRLLEERNSK